MLNTDSEIHTAGAPFPHSSVLRPLPSSVLPQLHALATDRTACLLLGSSEVEHLDRSIGTPIDMQAREQALTGHSTPLKVPSEHAH